MEGEQFRGGMRLLKRCTTRKNSRKSERTKTKSTNSMRLNRSVEAEGFAGSVGLAVRLSKVNLILGKVTSQERPNELLHLCKLVIRFLNAFV